MAPARIDDLTAEERELVFALINAKIAAEKEAAPAKGEKSGTAEVEEGTRDADPTT